MGRTLLSWYVAMARWYEAQHVKEYRGGDEDLLADRLVKLREERDALLGEIAADMAVERDALYLIDIYQRHRVLVGTWGFTDGALYGKVLGVLSDKLDARDIWVVETRTIIMKDQPRECSVRAFSSLERDNLMHMDDPERGLDAVSMFATVALEEINDHHGSVRQQVQESEEDD